MGSRHRMIAGGSLLALAGLLSAGTAAAAETAPGAATDGAQIEELIVTAQRREENVQKVPISMTVLGADAVKDKVQVTSDIGRLVPNVQIEQTQGFALNRTSIRGVAQADFNGGATTSNMVYLDDMPMNALIAQGMGLWDVGRAEVLRGPQGTLFGRNATGGAIRYITAAPTASLEGYAEVTLGRFDRREVRAAISGPLSDTVRARLSMISNTRDGDVTNAFYGRKDPGEDLYGVRASVDWDVTEAIRATLRVQTFKAETGMEQWKSTPGVTTFEAFGPLVNGFGTVANLQRAYGFQNLGQSSNYYRSETNVQSQENIRHTPVSVNVDWDLGPATLTSVTGYLDVAVQQYLDGDATPAPILDVYERYHLLQWSQEFRLTSNGDGPLKWIGGLFFLNERNRMNISIDATAWRGNVDFLFPDARTVFYQRGVLQELNTYAGFFHTSYQVSPKLTATAAVRYTYEKKDIDYTFRSQYEFPTAFPRTPNQFPDFVKAVRSGAYGRQLAAAEPPFSGAKSYSEVTWKVALDYQLNDRTLLYALVSKGFKGGSFKPTANSLSEVTNPDGTILSVRPEVVVDYEVGAKTTFWDGRARLNGSAYYYDYQDYQTNQFLPGSATQLLSNLPKAKLYGAELEVQLRPVDALTLSAGVGVAHSEITKSPDASLIGNKLPLSEDLNVNLLARYDIETAVGTFSPEISAKHYGKYYPNKENTKAIGDYTIYDARIDYEAPNGRYYASLWVKNLGDKIRPIQIDDTSEFFGFDQAFVNQHRTYGLTLGAHF